MSDPRRLLRLMPPNGHRSASRFPVRLAGSPDGRGSPQTAPGGRMRWMPYAVLLLVMLATNIAVSPWRTSSSWRAKAIRPRRATNWLDTPHYARAVELRNEHASRIFDELPSIGLAGVNVQAELVDGPAAEALAEVARLPPSTKHPLTENVHRVSTNDDGGVEVVNRHGR